MTYDRIQTKEHGVVAGGKCIMKRRVMMRVSGHVQGVFFRVAVRDKASELGLVGFVRNEHDNTVTIDIEGASEAMDTMIAWCKEGPDHVSVTDIKVEELELVGYTGFSIR